MQTEMEVMIMSAITIAFLHTVAGPDHYLPFIALSRARNWSLLRTLSWTIICGCGHVWSSVLLGLGGAAIGWSLSQVQWMQSVRGGLAGWGLLALGLIYATWGFISAKRNRPHKHFDIYNDGAVYVYEHKHGEMVAPVNRYPVTPWVMFIIFVLGPCEPMIPLLYYPGAQNSLFNLALLISIYTVSTLTAMLLLVVSGYYGFSMLKPNPRYLHALGGITIFVCGVGMVFLGW